MAPASSILLLLLFIISLQANSQNISSIERTALLSLDQHWGNIFSSVYHNTWKWDASSSPCYWPSVYCADNTVENTVVTRLSLSRQNIFGTIPLSIICQLKYLVSLEMSGNHLTGPIPAGLRDCSSLQVLDLSWNQLSGTIPSSIFHLQHLVSVDLSGNHLGGPIPACLRDCSSLQKLDLSRNQLSGTIPSSICQLKHLVSIDLSWNKLSGAIPAGIGNCTSLQELDLSWNHLSGTIPGEIFLLENLVTLSLRDNTLHGIIPTTIEKAVSLESLDLSNNYNLNGSIPYGITHLHNLSYLDLSINSFSGEIPTRMFSLRRLQSLSLINNNLSGTIPSELFLMKSLVTLSVSGNRLHGIIPATIQKAVSLESLDLSNNHNLNGPIPYGITHLHNLSYLDLSVNSFSGEIPTRLFSLRRLQYLSLGYNNLSGQLPPYIDMRMLRSLNLTHNRLSGPVLKSFIRDINKTYSRSLDISDNQLRGDIEYISLNLIWIAEVNLCKNNFSGMVPYEFVNHSFQVNCLDLSNLCSVKGATKSLQPCPFSLCSHRAFRDYQMCAAFNKLRVIIIITLGIAAVGGVRFVIAYCWVKRWKSNTSTKEEQEWKMVSFQGLKFETSDILSSLTDDNLIGHGGSGKVYRVFTNLKMTCVAVKSISISRISDHRAEKEFLAEVQTLGATWHYNIIKLLCFISGPDVKLLVYEYFENKSLDRWLHGSNSVTKLDWPTRMNIAIGAAQGLCYMHHHCPIPIIHRDIKSSNILLDSDFNAKIADFGLAKLLNTGGDTQTASAVAGTFGYIAPEYAYTIKVNTKSDVYSFGVVLLELTTGRKAVTRGDDVNLGGWAHLQCRDASATFDALDVSIKEAAIYLDQIISVFRLGVVCTAASPSNRPSMKDCLHILQNCSK